MEKDGEIMKTGDLSCNYDDHALKLIICVYIKHIAEQDSAPTP